MGLFLCGLCDEHLTLDAHQCDPKKIKLKIENLEYEKRIAEHRLHNMQDCVYKLLQDLTSLDSENVTVKSEFLKKLWDATQCQWWDANTADSFLVRWIALHRILVEAFDIFRPRRTLLDNLKELRIACDHAKNVFNYQSKLDLQPEDLVKNLG